MPSGVLGCIWGGVGGTCTTTMRLHISFYSAMSRGESPLMEVSDI